MLKKLFPISFTNLPLPLLLIGLFYIFIPVISYFATSQELEIPYQNVKPLLQSFNIMAISLNLMAFVIGLGLLGVKRWAYFLFLTFNIILTIHGVYLLVRFGITDRFLGNLGITLFSFFVVLYFLNREISIPYLTLIPRSFRKKWRIEIPIEGTLVDNGKEWTLTTVDISPTGCLAKLDKPVVYNEKFNITLNLDSKWETSATVIRVEDDNYVGMKFNYEGFRDPKKLALNNYLLGKLHPRFSKQTPAILKYANGSIEGDILNVSEGGFYFTPKGNEKVELGNDIEYSFSLFGLNYSGKGKVSWLNFDGKYYKPEGFGISFTDSQGIIYFLQLSLMRLLYSTDTRDR